MNNKIISKSKLLIILTLSSTLILILTVINNTYALFTQPQFNNTIIEDIPHKDLDFTVTATELIKDAQDEETLEHNTSYLQGLIDKVSKAGGGTINIPAGTYHFAPGGSNKNTTAMEYYVIKCKNNVLIKGEGIVTIYGFFIITTKRVKLSQIFFTFFSFVFFNFFFDFRYCIRIVLN